jgi:hypothetical protein
VRCAVLFLVRPDDGVRRPPRFSEPESGPESQKRLVYLPRPAIHAGETQTGCPDFIMSFMHLTTVE